MEAGRWSHRSRGFASSSRTHFAAGRAAKSAQVSASLLREGVARADQSQVWQEIAAKSVRLQARSDTGAMSEMYEVQHEGIESFVRGLPIADRQVGAVFILNDTPMGVDLFDSPQTFRSLIPKIVRGYALDAIDRRSNPASRASSSTVATRESARQFMRRVLDAPRTPFEAPGLGETWRLFAPQVSGGGLTVDGNLVHMSAFLTQEDSTLIPREL